MARVDRIDDFMRTYGIKLLYFIFITNFNYIFLNYVVSDDTENPIALSYSFYQTVWIWNIRIICIFMLIPSFGFSAVYLFAKFAPIDIGLKIVPSNGFIKNGMEKTVMTNGTYSNGKMDKKLGYLECLIIRIITRGDYRELIRRNVSYHVDLIERYCQCDRFEIHVVTEHPLDGDYQLGHSAQIRELLVPSEYKTPKGALYKGRNMVYWMENCPKDLDDTPKNKTWIISLDDDAFLAQSFLIDFLTKFIPSGAHCTACPSLFQVPSSTGILNALEESASVTLHCVMLWIECYIMKSTPLWFRGAAFAIRRDAEEEIGLDCTDRVSITEDHMFGHNFADSTYKTGYINGWIWEGAAFDLTSLIKQRARWFRGFFYSILYHDMSSARRLACILRLAIMFMVILPNFIIVIYYTALCCLGYYQDILPVGGRIWPWDYVTALTLANVFFITVFGAWYTLSTRKAILVTVSTFLWIGSVGMMAVQVAEMIWTIYTLVRTYFNGEQRREIMEKMND